MELEEGENSQYPLEDILDKYNLHVETFLATSDWETVLDLILAGELEDLQKFVSVIGKRCYNVRFKDEEGHERVKLVIE